MFVRWIPVTQGFQAFRHLSVNQRNQSSVVARLIPPAFLNGQLMNIALIHAELSETLESLRNGNPPDDKLPEFTSAEVELADTVIRVLDMAEARGWRVAEAMVAKHEFNRSREWKHGGKKF